jgi:hypothetical protein
MNLAQQYNMFSLTRMHILVEAGTELPRRRHMPHQISAVDLNVMHQLMVITASIMKANVTIKIISYLVKACR